MEWIKLDPKNLPEGEVLENCTHYVDIDKFDI